jgi:lysophospholipase L1-like esterase
MKSLLLEFLVGVAFVASLACAAAAADEPAADSQQKLLFVGDSITSGSGASSTDKRYTTLVTKMLNDAGGNFTEVNLGIGGSTLVDQFWPAPNSSGYPHRLRQAVAEQPNVFVMQHGTNDNALGHSVGRFLWAYRQSIRTVKEKTPGVTIVCMTICPSWDALSSTDQWVNQANVGIQEIAALEKTLLAPTYFKLHYRRELLPDGVHPDDAGQRVMAESIFEALKGNRSLQPNDFDVTFRLAGEYRICGYAIRALGSDEPADSSWVEFYHLGQKQFTYRSDYELEVLTPLRFAAGEVTVTVTFADASQKKATSETNDGCGQVRFLLPKTAGKIAKVQIEP